jgi:hypothetical protein
MYSASSARFGSLVMPLCLSVLNWYWSITNSSAERLPRRDWSTQLLLSCERMESTRHANPLSVRGGEDGVVGFNSSRPRRGPLRSGYSIGVTRERSAMPL